MVCFDAPNTPAAPLHTRSRRWCLAGNERERRAQTSAGAAVEGKYSERASFSRLVLRLRLRVSASDGCHLEVTVQLEVARAAASLRLARTPTVNPHRVAYNIAVVA